MTSPWLERRRRFAARVALYGSLVLVSLALAGGMAWLRAFLSAGRQPGQEWANIDFANLPEVKLLQQYVQIDTSERSGNEITGARFLAARLAEAGIPSEIEVLGNKHANLYARLEGADPHPLVLHNHIDVESVDPKEWFSPPFAAKIDVPWMYGRGTFDMKSVAIAQLAAMIDLKKSGRPLKRSVLFLATSSEEHGSRLGVRWILRQHPELVRSFWAVLTEGGAVEARARDEIKYWGTEAGQKRFVDIHVCGGDRAQLDALHKLLKERGYTETDLHITPEVRAYLASYGPTRDRPAYVEAMVHPETVLADVNRFRELPDYVKSLFRNEAVPFAVEAAPGGGWQMLIKLHLLPGVETAAVQNELLPPWMLHGLAVTVDEPPTARHGSPLDHPAFQAALAAVKERYPKAQAGPWFLPWTATDSRFFRAAGVPSYGFSPFLIMSTDTLQVDQANERFALPAFADGVSLYGDLVRRLVL
ncbi:MAG TPA: M20/M25/M40 family metallo-hydrolase [Thermoanaerobaculia bacterium]|jgi:acetylornithine deacetylase/succinyl-diaminopimelate desuccinylase-like protein|nr:M20/M25/M40 family metallo-hydrolase [Thermoanaerobaculia bacterium]